MKKKKKLSKHAKTPCEQEQPGRAYTADTLLSAAGEARVVTYTHNDVYNARNEGRKQGRLEGIGDAVIALGYLLKQRD